MWTEAIEVGVFCLCLYFAYLGCKQDFAVSPPPKRILVRKKIKADESYPKEPAVLRAEELPSYSEVCCPP